jgi:hypothetical protein
LISALPVLGAATFVPVVTMGQAPLSVLTSWNDGPAKQAILVFVRTTTDSANPKFEPPAERIAPFDQDGTLWVEHPIYSQLIYCLDRVPGVVKARPELAMVEPFETVMSGDRQATARFMAPELEKIVVATVTGISTEEFAALVTPWLATAKDPRRKRPYTDLTYQPMQEVLQYLRANVYKTYIVSGGGQHFIRLYAEQIYVPPEQVVGSAGGTTFGHWRRGASARTKCCHKSELTA